MRGRGLTVTCGRPPLANPRAERLLVRVTAREKRAIEANAAANEETVAEFVRRRCLDAADSIAASEWRPSAD